MIIYGPYMITYDPYIITHGPYKTSYGLMFGVMQVGGSGGRSPLGKHGGLEGR